jgi:hypothetical protein
VVLRIVVIFLSIAWFGTSRLRVRKFALSDPLSFSGRSLILTAILFSAMPEPPSAPPRPRCEDPKLDAALGGNPAPNQFLVLLIGAHNSSPTKKLVTNSARHTVMPTQMAVMNRDSMNIGFPLSQVATTH